MVSRIDGVDQLLCNSLESVLGAPRSGVISAGKFPCDPKVVFDRLPSDSLSDDRFLSMAVLESLVKDLKAKHSSGSDNIPNSVIKVLSIYFLRVLLIIFNNSININRIPKLWKISAVVFLKKNTSVFGDVGNYRPISLLCCFSKLLSDSLQGNWRRSWTTGD